MKKILYRKFLADCFVFFIISLVSTSVIIWIIQAVNYLDIVIYEGRDYSVYLNYALLSFPKIVSKILPFAFFFSFTTVIARYELKNELIIFWNFGVNKINFVNFFLVVSFILFFIQIFLTSFVVPKTQNLSKSIVRTSDYNFVDNFIKIKKFNAAVKNLTIYTESKDKDGNYNNIYIKKNTGEDNFQITYAKKGIFKINNGNTVLELYDGENINLNKGNLTNFSFSKSEFNLSIFSSDIILYPKIQEHKTSDLVECIFNLTDKDVKDRNKIRDRIHNCETKNLDNIIVELFKRINIPLYLPALMLLSLLLIIYSKEKINYSRFRIIVFLIGFFLIVLSEASIRFVGNSFIKNLFIFSVPILISLFLYFYFIYKFNFKSFSK